MLALAPESSGIMETIRIQITFSSWDTQLVDELINDAKAAEKKQTSELHAFLPWDPASLFQSGILTLENIYEIKDLMYKCVELSIRYAEPIAIGVIANYISQRIGIHSNLEIAGKIVRNKTNDIIQALEKVLKGCSNGYAIKNPFIRYITELQALHKSETDKGNAEEKVSIAQSIAVHIARSPWIPKNSPFKTLLSICEATSHAKSALSTQITLDFLNKLMHDSEKSAHWALLALKSLCDLSTKNNITSEEIQAVRRILILITKEEQDLRDSAYSTIQEVAKLAELQYYEGSITHLESAIENIFNLSRKKRDDAYAVLRCLFIATLLHLKGEKPFGSPTSPCQCSSKPYQFKLLLWMCHCGSKWDFDKGKGEGLLFLICQDRMKELGKNLSPEIVSQLQELGVYSSDDYIPIWIFMHLERELRNGHTVQIRSKQYLKSVVEMADLKKMLEKELL